MGSKNAPEAPAGDKAEEKHEQEEGKGKASAEETAAAPAVEEEKAEWFVQSHGYYTAATSSYFVTFSNGLVKSNTS